MAHCCYSSPDVSIYKDSDPRAEDFSWGRKIWRVPLWIVEVNLAEFEELEDLRAYLNLARKGGVYIPDEVFDRICSELQEDAV